MFPRLLDSTAVADFRSCPQKFLRAHVENLTPAQGKSTDLVAGGAYASGIEVYRRLRYLGESHDFALAQSFRAMSVAWADFDPPPDHQKSFPNMVGALIYATEVAWPWESDHLRLLTLAGPQDPAIEFTFAIPLPIDNPDTGDPLIYAGRFDAIVSYQGALFGLDDKTTSKLGPQWARQWDLRSQFTGYTWAAHQFGIPLQGFVVRGISILTGHTDPSEPKARKDLPYSHLQVITYRPQWLIDRWYSQLLLDIERMILCYQKGYWDYDLDTACTLYSGCPFQPLCLTPNPEAWLADYTTREWDPLAKVPFKP